VSPILFHMVSYLGAFPFPQDAPAVLGFEEMIIVVVIMTERFSKVLKNGSKNRNQLFYRSLAIYDRLQHPDSGFDSKETTPSKDEASSSGQKTLGFAIDEPANDGDEDEDDDGLALAALESLDAIDVFKHSDAPPISHSSIPSDNLRKLIMLLLLIAPLEPQESLSKYNDQLTGDNLERLRATAGNILHSFINVETDPGIKIYSWNTVIPNSLPFMFHGFNALFEHFLFSKNLDFTKHKEDSEATAESPKPIIPPPPVPPILSEKGEILDLAVLSQLSFFIPGSSIFRRLRLLYSGGNAGFSMRSFETKVFNWRAPSILLVSGTRISTPSTSGQERAFEDTLPPKRFPDSSTSSRLVFGVYVSQPWKQTYKTCTGDAETVLFQLEPTHEVFRASTINNEYISFTKSPTSHPGINIGSPHPKAKPTAAISSYVPLGSVSLYLNDSFEFGVFTHNNTSGGGAFHNSASRRRDWQDRFEIDSLEVWGCGGSAEAEEQRRRWAWEEREAEARRRVNIGKGDVEADRALLELAGIIGGNRSGGSIG
jgi:hypothetical protein